MVLPEHEESRAAVKFCFNLGYSATETYNTMQRTQHTKDMKKATVFKWFKRFKDGRSNISDDARSGRPSVITPTLVASVKTFIEEDRRRSIRDVVDGTGIAFGTVWNILHEHLHMKRICARWVPRLLTDFDKERRVATSKHFLQRVRREGDAFLNKIITCDETWIPLYDPETKQESSQWVDPATPRPVKAKVNRSAAKYMFIMFADTKGMLLCHAVQHGKTVNSEYYSKVIIIIIIILIIIIIIILMTVK
jgi:histone-lysine N-methyltransferase SETMAR